jgi:hypothetical protein
MAGFVKPLMLIAGHLSLEGLEGRMYWQKKPEMSMGGSPPDLQGIAPFI